MKTAWHDGTRELVFEPLEQLEGLAATTSRPETNLLICHGVLAARARWRARGRVRTRRGGHGLGDRYVTSAPGQPDEIARAALYLTVTR